MKHLLLGALALASVTLSYAVDAPRVKTISTPNAARVHRVSNNGEWAIGINTNSDVTEGVGGVLIKVADGSWQDIINPETSGQQGDVRDVTDDGEIVVGNYNGMPAYWTKTTGEWTTLPLPRRALSGIAVAVTPDGKYAVGETVIDDYARGNALWDLSTGKLISTPGLPVYDMQHENNDQNAFVDISPDGRYILGRLSFSYIAPPGLCSYVYDRNTSTYDIIGFTPNDKTPWAPKATGLYFIDDSYMSANGKYVTGSAYMVKETSGDFKDEYDTAFLYDIESREFTLYDNTTDQGIVGVCVTGNGTVYGAGPSNNPIRDWYVRSGNYWYPIIDIFNQHYGKSLTKQINAENSGTPTSVSDDGRTISVFTDPRGEGYIMTAYEDLADACANVDLLGNYSATPLSGSSFSTITEIKITFDRNIAQYGPTTNAYIVDAAGNKVRNSMGMNINSSTLAITFRPTDMKVGEEYKVVIPAGTVSILGDPKVTNREITITYKGRSTSPVKLVRAYPADGATISKLDFYTSQILLSFDTNVQFSGNEAAWLYRENESEPFAALLMSANANQVVLYPVATEYLYDGVNYRVELAAGSLTDVGGQGANEKIELNYVGSYVREVSSDDKYLFRDDFSGGPNNFMYYDGDFNEPNDEMKNYGFTKDESAWFIGRDSEESENFFMMSHSCYVPAGQSNDWMVTPQIYIPDDICRLTFDSQSFRKNKADRLKVYVIPSNTLYNYVSDAAMADFLENRILVYDELQNIGASEDFTNGEWTHNDISLAQFQGKSVYIAFVNDNTDQSIVFVDNVCVLHDMRFLVTVDAASSVVAKEEIEIKGRITIDAEGANYSQIALMLNDASGNNVSSISEDGLNLKTGDTYTFTFPNALPLAIGKEVAYSITVKLNDEETTVDRTVKNLAFDVDKKVVIEEYSGSQCGNCPGGIVALEHIIKTFGDKIVPITIRTYGGDKLSMGLDDYASFLGLSKIGAPSATFNRSTGVSTTYLAAENGAYAYSSTNPENPTWFDLTMAQLAIPADGEINIEVSYDQSSNSITVPCSVRYALDADNLNLGLFLVITEDHVEADYQDNYFYTSTDPIMGEWGVGGLYGSKRPRGVMLDDVARSIKGNSYNGSLGLLPSKMEGGEIYTATLESALPFNMDNINNLRASVLMIDCNTDRVINAARTSIVPSGIESIVAPSAAINFVVGNNEVSAYTANNTPVSLQLYTVSGILIGSAQGIGSVSVNANGYNGLAIVRATTAAGVKTTKANL